MGSNPIQSLKFFSGLYFSSVKAAFAFHIYLESECLQNDAFPKGSNVLKLFLKTSVFNSVSVFFSLDQTSKSMIEF